MIAPTDLFGSDLHWVKYNLADVVSGEDDQYANTESHPCSSMNVHGVVQTSHEVPAPLILQFNK